MKIKNYKIFASLVLVIILVSVFVFPSLSIQSPPEPPPPIPPPGLPVDGGIVILLISGLVYGIKKKFNK